MNQRASEEICDISELLEPRFFKALCDPNRLEMMIHLLHGGVPRTVTQIAESSRVDLSVVSRHLAMLRDVGILAAERRGKEVYYSVRTRPLIQTLRRMADAMEQCCPPVEEGEQEKKEAAADPSPETAAGISGARYEAPGANR
ncbi:MAG TPA: metalloregulator ArsR/SmtB family transcription factor [Myxococcaceae bacterium]|nr:metalloregulator ArsR/SmtB family transcription factor [Myxococcaceae bacterium]